VNTSQTGVIRLRRLTGKAARRFAILTRQRSNVYLATTCFEH
jgi:hypothetical protein